MIAEGEFDYNLKQNKVNSKSAMRKRNEPGYFEKEGQKEEARDYDKDFSGPGVIEFGLDLNTDQLRNMSPEELEKYLRREVRKRQHKGQVDL